MKRPEILLDIELQNSVRNAVEVNYPHESIEVGMQSAIAVLNLYVLHLEEKIEELNHE